MIKLTELLHTMGIRSEDEKDLVEVDRWKAQHAMHLEDIGFKNDGMYYYSLKNPEIKISYKKGVGFIVDDKSKKEKKVFQKFEEMEEYFQNYDQKYKDEPYQ